MKRVVLTKNFMTKDLKFMVIRATLQQFFEFRDTYERGSLMERFLLIFLPILVLTNFQINLPDTLISASRERFAEQMLEL